MQRLMTAKWAMPALGLMAILMAVLFSATIRPVSAAAIVVNSDLDTVADDGVCTLREAITASNTNTSSGWESGECVAGSSADNITFSGDFIITLEGQLPPVTAAMTITGNGVAKTIVQASTCNPVNFTFPGCTRATYRVFEVGPAGNLMLDGLTVRHGMSIYGSGIHNDGGTLAVHNAIISDNSADILDMTESSGIYSTGTLILTNSTISDNIGFGILGEGGTMTVTNSTISGNWTEEGGYVGGGIQNIAGTMTLTGSTVSDNRSDFGSVGGIDNTGTAFIVDSTISRNTSRNDGGILNTGKMSITGSTISDNPGYYGLGGIGNFNEGEMIITNSAISGNDGQSGGGIVNTGKLTIIGSTITGNTTYFANGGGIKNGRFENPINASLTVINSTISGNVAPFGGGIDNASGMATVTNSTISGNWIENQDGYDGDGGGIYNRGTLALTRSLIAGNSATGEGSELFNNSGTVNANAYNVLSHSGLTTGQAFQGFTPGATDFNASNGQKNVPLGNILYSTLADNGGPTETLALVAGSPAIDIAPHSDCSGPPVNGLDQRGIARLQGHGCDAGAYEVVSFTPTPISTKTPTPTTIPSETPVPPTTPTISVTVEPSPTSTVTPWLYKVYLPASMGNKTAD